MVHDKLDTRSLQLDPEPSKHLSSFLDAYHEDQDNDKNPDSEDDFDQSTLSEIVILFKSEDGPSKSSLLPSPRDIIEDYKE